MQSACNESMKGNGETFILLSGSLDYSQRQAQSLFWTKCHRVGIQLTRRPARWLSNAYHCTYLLSILEILQYMVRHSVWRHTLAWIRTVEAHWFGLLQNWTTACKKNNTYTHLGAASCQWLQFSSTRPTSLCPDGVMQVLTWIYSISYKVGPSVALCWEWNPFTVINADGGALDDCTHLKDRGGKRPKECCCHGRFHILTSCFVYCWQRQWNRINTHISIHNPPHMHTHISTHNPPYMYSVPD